MRRLFLPDVAREADTAELAAALAGVAAHPALAAIEIAEYNPERDRGGRTAAVVTQLLDAMLVGPQLAHGTPSLIELDYRYGAHHHDPLPVSAFAARRDVMEVFTPGDHGSTFGGGKSSCGGPPGARDLPALRHQPLKRGQTAVTCIPP